MLDLLDENKRKNHKMHATMTHNAPFHIIKRTFYIKHNQPPHMQLLVYRLHSDTSPLPTSRDAPSPHEQPARYPHANRHSPERRRVAALAIAQNIVGITLDAWLITGRGSLVHHRVDGAPESRSSGWGHGKNTPVRAEVLDAPYYAYDDGRQREDCAVAGTDEGGDGGEAGCVVLHPA